MAEWHDQLPDDLKENASLADFKDVGGLAKSYIETKAKVGTMTTIPDGRSSEEAWNGLWNKLGRPESADRYEFELPEVQGHTYDEEYIEAFKASAHSLGLTTTQAQGIFNHQMSAIAEQGQEMEDDDVAEIEKATAELRTKWGLTYDAQTGAINRAVTNFFNEDDHAGLNALIASNSTLAEAFARIGGLISENSSGGGDMGDGRASGMTKEDAQAKINEIRGDKDHVFYKRSTPGHEEAVLEMAELYKVVLGTAAA